MLNNIKHFVDTHPIGRVFGLGQKKMVWKKVHELKPGAKIAVNRDGKLDWDEIVSVKKVGRERVYDVEIEGTHNFVGNGIIAHNTYISGSVGIGISAPSYPFHVGTTEANSISGFFTGYVAAPRIVDTTSFTSYFLDLANVSDSSSSLSLAEEGSIRFNSTYSGGWKKIVNGPSSKIQSVYDVGSSKSGLLLSVSGVGLSASAITWGQSLFISANPTTLGNVGIGTTAPMIN